MAEPYDDDNFEEDGCTMDFFDETDPPSSGAIAGPVYRHYEGEDFAQYLDDDVDPSEPQWDMGLAPDRAANTRRRISTANIREKLGRLLLTSASGRSKNSAQGVPPQQNLSRIYDVSFADCKMGNVDRPSEGSALGSDSGIDCRSGFSLETESDLGTQTSSSWWDMDTLSSSRRQPRSSASAIDLPRSVADYSSNGSGREHRRLDTPEVRPSCGSEVAAARDPALRSSNPERTDGSNKRLTNPFRKIYNTLSRRKAANLQQMSYAQDYEDVRL